MIPNYYTNNYSAAGANPYYQLPPCMRVAPLYPNLVAPQQIVPAPIPPTTIAPTPTVPEQTITLPDSWTFGPIKIEWAFDGESINVVLKMFEQAIRTILLSLSKPSISITTTIGTTTINLTIKADFTERRISILGAVCLDTVCTTFNNTVIATW